MSTLILVTGYPATGKTSLAKAISTKLQIPLFTKDGIKEILFDTLGYEKDREELKIYSHAAYGIMFSHLDEELKAQRHCILESNFTEKSTPYIKEVVAKNLNSFVVQIICFANPATTVQRFFDRQANGDRHKGHRDDLEDREKFTALVSNGPIVLDLDGPKIFVDTTRFQAVSYVKIIHDLAKYTT
jgi:predicted kinase